MISSYKFGRNKSNKRGETTSESCSYSTEMLCAQFCLICPTAKNGGIGQHHFCTNLNFHKHETFGCQNIVVYINLIKRKPNFESNFFIYVSLLPIEPFEMDEGDDLAVTLHILEGILVKRD